MHTSHEHITALPGLAFVIRLVGESKLVGLCKILEIYEKTRLSLFLLLIQRLELQFLQSAQACCLCPSGCSSCVQLLG